MDQNSATQNTPTHQSADAGGSTPAIQRKGRSPHESMAIIGTAIAAVVTGLITIFIEVQVMKGRSQ